MLFRNKDGELVIICKSAYKNDILYYKTIIKMLATNANVNVVASSSSSTQMDNMVNTISQLLYHKR